MESALDEQVIEFYGSLFDELFSQPFADQIQERLRRRAVIRQIEDAADAASPSLLRFLTNQGIDPSDAKLLLGRLFDALTSLDRGRIGRAAETPETLAAELLDKFECPEAIAKRWSKVYRYALLASVQLLNLVGPLLVEWETLGFPRNFELPRRVVNRLNEIAQSIEGFAGAGQEAVDENYELDYRDHLLQRFYRAEAGTVAMTTNLAVDVRRLFVMPRVEELLSGDEAIELVDQMADLATARKQLASVGEADEVERPTALEWIRENRRGVLIGTPGSGKSTLFEWLQLQLAGVDEELTSNDGRQLIPMLLRIRQLDPHQLPTGDEMIAAAVGGRHLADLAPPGWTDRQLAAGRVVFLLDGLDEVDPDDRDQHVLPWLTSLCQKFSSCRFFVSSRPVGYVRGALSKLEFAEAELSDFDAEQIEEYSRHWCIAVRLAQNEPEEEAERSGAEDGAKIAEQVRQHEYVRNLSRSPLMLSAICLVSYFEAGELPRDRARLYKLCVEGLLHYWDQRRGIHSEYELSEKLRVCSAIALQMQTENRAEFEAPKIEACIAEELSDAARATTLLEHIRYRTGLLIERRPGVFAFAHLTFQEYLAACAISDGVGDEITPNTLIEEAEDSRWSEVAALFCGISSRSTVREVLEGLASRSSIRADVLASCWGATKPELRQEESLFSTVMQAVARAPGGPDSGNVHELMGIRPFHR